MTNYTPVCEGCRQLAHECICDIVRWDLIRRIRREIAEGTYYTNEKMQEAMKRMMEQDQ